MMDEERTANTALDGAEGLAYPVEFELRVIHLLSEGAPLAKLLDQALLEHGVSLEAPRPLPASGKKYGRLACRVRFEDKDSLYAVYAAIGTLPGVKVVL